jgi:hypothetical protein
MKSFMILGAMIGFLIGAGFSLMGNCPWPIVLWRACIAALASAVLVRWWSRSWLQGLQNSVEKRRQVRPASVGETKPATKL